MSKSKQYILKLIYDTFDDYTLERMQDYNEECGFKTFSQFAKHNKKCVQELSDTDADFYKTLCEKIQDGNIDLVDEDNFIEWTAYTIYFNKKGNLVIMHPR